MEQSGNEKIKHKSKNSVVKRIFSWKNILYFCVCAAVLFLAVEYTSKAIALHGTDTLDDGASVISEADGALTVSSIPDVDDIWQFSEEFSALNATH
ncbi:MAG: hypothetical protein IJZ90_02850, partial [Clostridia bacterium]|nr:hypothetical protein [Clostridia bacterium]